jgi:hypothetical protein
MCYILVFLAVFRFSHPLPLMPKLQNFDDRSCESIGIIPNHYIELGDKTILFYVVVMETLMDFNLLPRCFTTCMQLKTWCFHSFV